jgi:hypothetical protein
MNIPDTDTVFPSRRIYEQLLYHLLELPLCHLQEQLLYRLQE